MSVEKKRVTTSFLQTGDTTSSSLHHHHFNQSPVSSHRHFLIFLSQAPSPPGRPQNSTLTGLGSCYRLFVFVFVLVFVLSPPVFVFMELSVTVVVVVSLLVCVAVFVFVGVFVSVMVTVFVSTSSSLFVVVAVSVSVMVTGFETEVAPLLNRLLPLEHRKTVYQRGKMKKNYKSMKSILRSA